METQAERNRRAACITYLRQIRNAHIAGALPRNRDFIVRRYGL
jgi:hypothetical protein